jgi:hypothetical protein
MNSKFKFAVVITVLVAMVSLSIFPAVAQPTGGLLSGIPVTGVLSDGGTFEGVLSVTELALDDGQLLVSGLLEGTATDATGLVTEISQTFELALGTLLGGGAGGVCDILFLDLGPLFLDVLGLTVDLSQITLDINAVPGAGNLLGNLLCAVAGLLDGTNLAGLTRLVDLINNLL